MLSRKSVDTTRFVSTAGCSCWLQLYQLLRLVAHNSICINCDLYHLQLDLYRLISLTRLVSTAGFQSRLKTNSIVAFSSRQFLGQVQLFIYYFIRQGFFAGPTVKVPPDPRHSGCQCDCAQLSWQTPPSRPDGGSLPAAAAAAAAAAPATDKSLS